MAIAVVLDIHNLTCTFPNRKGITDITLQLKKGEVYCLNGGHEAGKTLLLQVILGAVPANSGTIKVFNERNGGRGSNRIGYVPQDPQFIGGMTGKDVLHYFSLVTGSLEREFDHRLPIDLMDKKPANKLPLYTRKILSLGVALLGNPDFILADEPFLGLDARECEQLISLLSLLNKNKTTGFLLTGQNYPFTSQIATTYGVLREGRLVAEFTRDSLAERCQKCIKIRTPQLLQAIPVLHKEFPQYEVLSDDTLRVFCPLPDSARLNTTLVMAGVEVAELWIAGMDPQAYLSDLAGGGEHA